MRLLGILEGGGPLDIRAFFFAAAAAAAASCSFFAALNAALLFVLGAIEGGAEILLGRGLSLGFSSEVPLVPLLASLIALAGREGFIALAGREEV